MYTLSIREGEGEVGERVGGGGGEGGGWMSYGICAGLRWQIARFATLLPLQNKRSPPMIEIGKEFLFVFFF